MGGMDLRKAADDIISLRRVDMEVQGRDVLKDITGDLTENDWERIEKNLLEAVR